jgi:hypothetical protein
VADLTTIDGLQFHFDPGVVTAVADHDADTLQAVTTVYGLTDGRVRIAESPEGFLDRIGVAGAFVRLTRPNDTFVWVNCAAVTVVQSPPRDQYPPVARALVTVGGLTQAVKETPLAVKEAVSARGGKL